MKYNSNSGNKTVINVFASILIVFLPSIFALTGQFGQFGLAAAVCALTAFYYNKNTRSFFPFTSLIACLLFVFSLIQLFWVKNPEGHFAYMMAAVTVVFLNNLLCNYFNQNRNKEINRRLKLLIIISAVIYVLVNIVIWLIYYLPSGKKYTFSIGMGSGDFAAISCFLVVILIIGSIKLKASGMKKYYFALLVMLVQLVLCRSAICVFFALASIVLMLLDKKGKKIQAAVVAALLTGFFAALIIIVASPGLQSDSVVFGITHPYGWGGGAYLTTWQCYARSFYGESGASLLAKLASSSGILGILSAIIVVLHRAYVCIKKQGFYSKLCLLTTIFVILLPMKSDILPIVILVSMLSFDDYAGMGKNNELKKSRKKQIMIAAALLCILFTMFTILSAIRQTAENCIKRGEYLTAYERYSFVARINPLDSESAKGAYKSLKKASLEMDYYDSLSDMLSTAALRSKNDAYIFCEKGNLYYDGEEYKKSMNQYQKAVELAPHNNAYKIKLAQSMFKIITKSAKGSEEIKNLYADMIKLSEGTNSLDDKKQLNDIIDKAFVYTRGEIQDE